VETTWKLYALPDEEAYWGGVFPGMAQAGRFAAALMGSALLPACIFLLDAPAAQVFARLEGFPAPEGGAFAWVGFDGRAPALRRQLADTAALAARNKGEGLSPRDRTGDAAGAYLMGEGEPVAQLQLRLGAPPAALAALHGEIMPGLRDALPPPTPEGSVESVLDYPAGRITLRIGAGCKTDGLAPWIAETRRIVRGRGGFLLVERGPAALRAGSSRGGGAEPLMRAVQAQLDPDAVLTPERLFS
jgi:FAD/FMN-containing dehydrogenase